MFASKTVADYSYGKCGSRKPRRSKEGHASTLVRVADRPYHLSQLFEHLIVTRPTVSFFQLHSVTLSTRFSKALDVILDSHSNVHPYLDYQLDFQLDLQIDYQSFW
jgi:hypothetical protein